MGINKKLSSHQKRWISKMKWDSDFSYAIHKDYIELIADVYEAGCYHQLHVNELNYLCEIYSKFIQDEKKKNKKETH